MKAKKITLKQKIFVKYYVANFNATQAAIKAGYSKNSARQLGAETLSKPYIKKEIYREVKKKMKEAEITFEWKINILKNVIKKCMEGENLKGGHFQPNGVISAISELNKMMGDYKQNDDSKNLSPQDLSAIHEMIKKYGKEY